MSALGLNNVAATAAATAANPHHASLMAVSCPPSGQVGLPPSHQSIVAPPPSLSQPHSNQPRQAPSNLPNPNPMDLLRTQQSASMLGGMLDSIRSNSNNTGLQQPGHMQHQLSTAAAPVGGGKLHPATGSHAGGNLGLLSAPPPQSQTQMQSSADVPHSGAQLQAQQRMSMGGIGSNLSTQQLGIEMSALIGLDPLAFGKVRSRQKEHEVPRPMLLQTSLCKPLWLRDRRTKNISTIYYLVLRSEDKLIAFVDAARSEGLYALTAH